MPFYSMKDLNEGFDRKYGQLKESVSKEKKAKKSLKESVKYRRLLSDKVANGEISAEDAFNLLLDSLSEEEVKKILSWNNLLDGEEVDEGMNKPVREGKYGFLKKIGDYRIIETPTAFVVTDKFGTTIGQSRTLSGAEGIAEEHEKSLKEDTVKTSKGKWVNKGDTGETHGEFKTKKEADAQRKAIFAQGFKK